MEALEGSGCAEGTGFSRALGEVFGGCAGGDDPGGVVGMFFYPWGEGILTFVGIFGAGGLYEVLTEFDQWLMRMR